MTPIRYVVLCKGRAGSNWLRSMLQTREDVLDHGETFHPEKALPAAVCHIRKLGLNAYLEDLFRGPLEVLAVGFKLKYDHARTRVDGCDLSGVWSWLRRENGLRFVHLTRRNQLRAYVSRLLARKTGEWVRPSGASWVHTTVRVDPEACRRAIATMQAETEEIRTTFADCQVFDLVYEDLLDAVKRQYAEVEAFLGLPSQPPRWTIERQNTGKLHEVISNYAELAAELTGSHLERWLD